MDVRVVALHEVVCGTIFIFIIIFFNLVYFQNIKNIYVYPFGGGKGGYRWEQV